MHTYGVFCSIPAATAAKVLQQRFNRDEGYAWKLELVRRRTAVTTAEGALQAAKDADTAALAAYEAASNRLQTLQAALQPNGPGSGNTASQLGTTEDRGDAQDDELNNDGDGLAAADTVEPLSPEDQQELQEAEQAANVAKQAWQEAVAKSHAAGKEHL